MKQKISFDDLPKMSPWPARLLGAEHWAQRTKSPKEILREFNLERWKSILDLIKNSPKPMTVADVDTALMAEKEVAFSYKNEFWIDSWISIQQLNLNLYAEVLMRYRNQNTSGLVELGAGYGSILLNLANRNQLNNLPIFAGEYAENGIEALGILAKNASINAKVGYCDLGKGVLTNLDIPTNSIVFTSLASYYVPSLTQEFIDFFISLTPQVVIHFEPCLNHYPANTIYGLMCRKYMEINDYNGALLNQIYAARDLGKLIILEEQKNIIGLNPFLPISIVAWKPTSSH